MNDLQSIPDYLPWPVNSGTIIRSCAMVGGDARGVEGKTWTRGFERLWADSFAFAKRRV